MRFAVQILYFDCEQFILHAIDNCAPFVEKIYISYSKLPWNYNQKARQNYVNTVDKELLRSSKHYSKIELVEGDWLTEEEQRNFCLKKAKDENFDYMIIQDADEFYTNEDYAKNLKEITDNPDHPYYRNPWYLFWKNLQYVIEFDEVHGKKNTTVNYSACFAVNCRQDVWFKKNRLVNTTNAFFLSGLCYHLSYIMSDEQMLRKISTWGHSHQVKDINEWFLVKWKGWTPSTVNISPINPPSWKRAKKFEGRIPEILENFKLPETHYEKAPLSNVFRYKMLELYCRGRNLAKKILN